jgi:hypothetical protein
LAGFLAFFLKVSLDQFSENVYVSSSNRNARLIDSNVTHEGGLIRSAGLSPAAVGFMTCAVVADASFIGYDGSGVEGKLGVPTGLIYAR